MRELRAPSIGGDETAAATSMVLFPVEARGEARVLVCWQQRAEALLSAAMSRARSRVERVLDPKMGEGTTLSMADGHAEYWKWKGRETVTMPRELYSNGGKVFLEILKGDDYEPQTEDGMYDLRRLQKATWGRLGYSIKQAP